YKDHGKSYEAVYEREHPPRFRWLHEGFGTNWRMLEMQAAIGRIQLQRMAEWTEKRTLHAERLRAAFLPFTGEGGAIRVPALDPAVGTHAHYKFYAYLRPENLAAGWTRDRIIEAISAHGVPCYQGSCS